MGHYRAYIESREDSQREIWFSDGRSPGELGSALATEGYILVVRGDANWVGVRVGGKVTRGFKFVPKGQTVLFRDHVLRIDVVNESDPEN